MLEINLIILLIKLACEKLLNITNKINAAEV